ncbi:MAG: hypothetical protein PWR25_61 [Euryarchaeota archaeon]|jgi:hypothetical protein|nr:hypothetical protein [Euryarchaeota archaeon]MDN5339100.1 hypothetical protein [Euryarchaeota archaeon]
MFEAMNGSEGAQWMPQKPSLPGGAYGSTPPALRRPTATARIGFTGTPGDHPRTQMLIPYQAPI